MSVSVAASADRAGLGRLGTRLVIVAAAIAAAVAVLTALAWFVAPGVAAPPPRSPFGIGFREAAPSATGLSGWLLAMQASFSRSLQGAVAGLKAGGGWWPLISIGFAYGVFHAAGPGHGKAVIAGYLLAGERSLRRGLGLSVAAALLQACVAILIVAIGMLVLNATAAGMSRAGTVIETASFALVAGLGAVLVWRKAGRLAGHGPSDCAPGCAHLSLADAARIDRLEGWRARLGVIFAAGSRPCAGAVLILVFSASQGVLPAGIAATLAMALGTALTTGALASLAVFAKGLALRLAGGRGQAGVMALGALEVLAAGFVLVLGLAMLAGLASTAGA